MVADLEIELLNFPAGKHDDIVDALGLVGQLLDYMQEVESLIQNRKSQRLAIIALMSFSSAQMIG